MENKNRNIGFSDLLLVLLSAVFLIGIRSFFAPCGPKEDGSWMTCHWAGQAVSGAAAVLLCLAVAHLLVRNRGVKAGLSMAMIPTAALTMLIPGKLIHMCMMQSMRCHSVMKPGVIVCAVLTILAAVFDLTRQNARMKQETK